MSTHLRLGASILLAALFSGILGWFLINAGSKYAGNRIETELTLGLTSTSALLSRTLSKPLMLARLLAKDDLVLAAQGREVNPADLGKINRLLESSKKISGSSHLAVFSRQGTLLAADKSASGHLGQDFSFRPYIRESLAGRESHYFAYGATDNLRGYYASVPIRIKEGEIAGVAMAKFVLDEQILNLNRYERMYLVSPDGVVLLASNPDWLLKSIRPISQERRRQLQENRQFGENPITPLDLGWDQTRHLVRFGGETYLFKEETVTDDGWKLVMLKPETLIHQYRWLMTALALVIFIVALGSMLFLSKQQQIARILEQYNSELEKTVAERTGELNASVTALESEISERQTAQDALQKSEERLRHFFEHANIGLAITSPEKGWISVNQHVSDILGYTENELQQKSWTEMTHPDDLQEDLRQFDRLLKGEIDEYELNKRFFRKNGEIVYGHLTVSCTRRADASIDFIIATVEDISRQKRLEEHLLQGQKMEAIGTLAGGIAHDFNNILAAIIGYSELALLDSKPGNQTDDCLKEILKASYRARDLIQQILTFSRKSEGDVQQIIEPHLILKESLKLLRSSIPSSIEIREEIEHACGAIKADPVKIQQLVMNLCTNALHAMEKEKGTLKISLTRRLLAAEDLLAETGVAPGPFIELMVSDTGKGMDKRTRERIFEPYFTTKEIGKGTGLGLAIVHGIVRELHGLIKIESEPGQGTVFRIFFPAVAGPPPEGAPERERGAPGGGGERILLVDDEEQIIRSLEEILTRFGYRVISMANSADALREFRATPESFDLVITDQTMPHLTGIEMAGEMLQIRPDLPIILCSGHSTLISEQTAKTTGIREIVMKPVRGAELARIVGELLDGKEPGTA